MKVPSLKNTQGFVALITLVLMTALVVILAYSAGTLGLGELQMSYTAQKGLEALSVADGCVDEVLRRFRLDANYGISAGTIVYTLNYGTCSLDVVDLGSGQRRLTVTGTTAQYNKKIEVVVQTSSTDVTIVSWAEKNN